MAEETKSSQVNVSFEKDPELLRKLDEIVDAEESDRSKFIRLLVRREVERRQQIDSPPSTSQSNKRRGTAA